MKKLLMCITLALINHALYAQIDTIPKEQNIKIEVYDVVAVYKESTDGRGQTRKYVSELKGKILNYDESTGVLTFKGNDGKMYSFKSGDYKYFEYDKEFTSKIKHVVILPRKDSGFEFSAGISAGYFKINHNFTADDFYMSGFQSGADIPICLKLGASKYLNKNSLVGLTAEYALLIDDNSYFNVGARYQYLYNPNKNSAFYFPVELKFSRYQFNSQYQTSDTTYIDDLNWEYPSRSDTKVALNNLELNIGQGLSFALKNKKTLSLELMLVKQFVLSQTFKNVAEFPPKSKFGVNGLKLSVFMNF
jgi:hypothetical protein